DRVVGVNGHLDDVVVARDGLVDRVDHDLLHEVVEAADPGRADVHPGAQTDRLEPFEHGDVLGRVSGLRLSVRHNQEMPAKPQFCQARKVYQIWGSERPRARLKETAFCTLSRSFSSLIAEAIAAARSASSGATSTGFSTGSSSASGSGPGAKRIFATPSRSAISTARCPRSNAHTESAVLTCTVPSRAMRAGHALRAIEAPTISGHRSTSSAMPACGPCCASSRRISSPSGSRIHLHDLRGLD